jgi:L-fuculose-phosphate aldolase
MLEEQNMTVEGYEVNLRQQLAAVSVQAYHRGLVGGTGGNLSVRLGEEKMLITPSGVSLGDTTPDNIVRVTISTLDWEPNRAYIPSKEIAMHAALYQELPHVRAVCHCHPPYATAYAVLGMDIPYVTDAAFKQPPMPHVSFSPSGTRELAEKVGAAARANPGLRTILLDQHGVITVGSDLVAAYNFMDLAEEIARIAYLSGTIRRAQPE